MSRCKLKLSNASHIHTHFLCFCSSLNCSAVNTTKCVTTFNFFLHFTRREMRTELKGTVLATVRTASLMVRTCSTFIEISAYFQILDYLYCTVCPYFSAHFLFHHFVKQSYHIIIPLPLLLVFSRHVGLFLTLLCPFPYKIT